VAAIRGRNTAETPVGGASEREIYWPFSITSDQDSFVDEYTEEYAAKLAEMEEDQWKSLSFPVMYDREDQIADAELRTFDWIIEKPSSKGSSSPRLYGFPVLPNTRTKGSSVGHKRLPVLHILNQAVSNCPPGRLEKSRLYRQAAPFTLHKRFFGIHG
jgi:hypothetical protein